MVKLYTCGRSSCFKFQKKIFKFREMPQKTKRHPLVWKQAQTLSVHFKHCFSEWLIIISHRRKFSPCLSTRWLYKYFQHIIPFIYFVFSCIYLLTCWTEYSLLSASTRFHTIFHNICLLFSFAFQAEHGKKNFPTALVNIYLWWKSAEVITPIQQLTRFSL